MTFVRFVVPQIDEESTFRSGVIQAGYALCDSDRLTPEEEARVISAAKWLDKNLPEPKRFARKRNVSHKATRGICWFKDTALESIRYVREIAEVLKAHGVVVEMLTAFRPGYVVYEDEYQVVAEPFSSTPR
jgi:hypothetical protein